MPLVLDATPPFKTPKTSLASKWSVCDLVDKKHKVCLTRRGQKAYNIVIDSNRDKEMKLSKQERQELEDKKLTLEVRNKRLDILRLAIQIPLTALLLVLAIIELVKLKN
ncbi:hypothetical protein [Vibrio furnissii]|uniref:hypothetical protein n=1 Tax=Vibrio furnissii TaxID=29494 RepID=UPI001C9D1917|nr:hypothetical protein [Vibrio furnissii]MBY7933095.1 hypothetical protein [Vibrio fluvialis]MCG6230247.1 hypothetical protein [Vibrio furnissii]MCG6268446.1 hypothetical protein [Vibrio furnissii]